MNLNDVKITRLSTIPLDVGDVMTSLMLFLCWQKKTAYICITASVVALI